MEGIESFERIEVLAPFLGAWEGDEIFHEPGGASDRTQIYRQLIRPHRVDYILSVEYRNDHLSSVDVIIYSPDHAEYRFIQPGVRYMAPTTQADAEIPIKFEAPNRLSWQTIVEGDPDNHTVVLADGEWREEIVLAERTGPPLKSTAVLKRSDKQRWQIPS